MLAGIFKDLTPGGWLALEVPDLRTRLEEGILGCFAHEHISYFVPETFRRLIEQAGFTVRAVENSRDGLAVLAQKLAPDATAAPPSTDDEIPRRVTELVSNFLRKRAAQRERFDAELARWTGPKQFVIYGGDSHTTDLLVERWLPVENVRCIIDDDPAKQGCVAAGFTIPVAGRNQLPAPGDALVVLSAFGHHDRLWENLAEWRQRGGAVMRFYPQCELVAPNV
jgi:hypothetical protein